MTQITASIGKDKYRTTLSNGKHEIVADEPIPFGLDHGPSPYDLLLMALGACISMTLRIYADQKKWDLQEVQVNLVQNRIHAKDCEDCDSKEGFAHIIDKNIQFVGNLDEKQRARLLEISEKCPVQRTLMSQIKINTKEIL